MRQKIKIILSDNDPEFLISCQQALAQQNITAITVPRSAEMLWDAILRERPQAVICDLFMAGCDAVHIMDELKRTYDGELPLFAAFCSTGNDRLFQRFLESGGAYVFIKPADPRYLAARMKDILGRYGSPPSFDEPCRESANLDAQVCQMLRGVGVPAHLSGYHCLKAALLLLFRNETQFCGTHGLYEAVAKETGSSYRCVERNIRTAIEASCARCGSDITALLFGSSISQRTGKPTNVQFITALYEQIRHGAFPYPAKSAPDHRNSWFH